MSLYVASRSQFAELWRSLRLAGLPISASWIDGEELVRSSDGSKISDCRLREATNADAVILYNEDTDTPITALLEAGAALAAGKRVVSVGPRLNSLGREGHPNWLHCDTLPEAIRSLRPRM